MFFQCVRLIYSFVLNVSTPLLIFNLRRRVRHGKEDETRLNERYGKPSVPRPDGKILWVHGASVGEALAVLPVTERLLSLEQDLSIVVTTGTVTSAHVLQKNPAPDLYHQFAPLDRHKWVSSFLDFWAPEIVVWMESEFWPNTINLVKQRNIPLILLNGRISDQSYRNWKLVHPFIKGLLGCFSICLAQSQQDAHRLKTLGATNVTNTGNLKLGAAPLPHDASQRTQLENAIGNRRTWLLASTHEGEEHIALDVHRFLNRHVPQTLTIIVPRHPHRGPGITQYLRSQGVSVTLRSHGQLPDEKTEIYISDTVGELGLMFMLSQIVFMGKSLVEPGGGQNPVEAARLKRAVLFGPNMSNFAEISREMLDQGAALQTSSPDELASTVLELLTNDQKREQMCRKAAIFCEMKDNVIDVAADTIRTFMRS